MRSPKPLRMGPPAVSASNRDQGFLVIDTIEHCTHDQRFPPLVPCHPPPPRYSYPPMAKRIAILGSTGSIGTSALDVLAHLGPDYRATALSAHSQADKLIEQMRQFRPASVAVTDESQAAKVRSAASALGTRVYVGAAGVVEMVQRDDIDIVLAAIVGAAGLPAVFAAVRSGKTLALANKEALVVAGSLLIPEAKKRGVAILPVDSEHSAIFQAAKSGKAHEITKLILTASGGPFRNASREKIENATLADALNHPTWQMGTKITIDSATMFNKGLELIEACWLFDLPPEKIEIVVHPESIIHSMVEFRDGSIIAQMGPPDMRTPIQYALTYPERLSGNSRKLDLTQALSLHFQPPDYERFPALRLAQDVARRGGTLGSVLNAANEAAVAAFASGNIPFGGIARAVAHTIQAHSVQPAPSLDDLLEADRWARRTTGQFVQEWSLDKKVACSA
jgi:1-deoxy-D-xylulose-5-phosphate reductoisomerase